MWILSGVSIPPTTPLQVTLVPDWDEEATAQNEKAGEA